jgi:hypothetical protein
MSKKLLAALAPMLAVVALGVTPTLAQAAPVWKVNLETEKQGTSASVVTYGTLTMENSFVGTYVCPILAGGRISNEAGVGQFSMEGWEPYLCKTSGGIVKECEGGAIMTAENPVEIVVKSEKEVARRGTSSLPWPGELTERVNTGEIKEGYLKARSIRLTLVCPVMALEIPFDGTLEPRLENGAKNGLHPSRLVFKGKETGPTETGALISQSLEETEKQNVGYVSGEVTVMGLNTNNLPQLVTLGF